MDALVFPVGTEWYALPLTEVREIIPALSVTPMPGAPVGFLGVANLRGELLPVLDTAGRLGVQGGVAGPYVAIVDTPRGPAGLVTTGTPEPASLGDPIGSGEGPAAVGRFPVGDRVATLLDLADLVRAG